MNNNDDINEEYSINEILEETNAMSEEKNKSQIKDNINKIIAEKSQGADETHFKKKNRCTSEFIKNILKKKKNNNQSSKEIFSRNDKKIKTNLTNPLDYVDNLDNKKNQITLDDVINTNKTELSKNESNTQINDSKQTISVDDVDKKEENIEQSENLNKDKSNLKDKEPLDTADNVILSSDESAKLDNNDDKEQLKSDTSDASLDINNHESKEDVNDTIKISDAKDDKKSQTSKNINTSKKIIRGKIKKSNNVIISDINTDEAINVINNELFLYERHKNISKNIRSVINKKDQSSKRFNLFGSVEEEDYEFEENTVNTEIVDDYTSEKDISLIKKELSLSNLRLLARLIITFITMLISVSVTILFRTNLPFIQNSNNLSSLYLSFNLILIIISALSSISVITNGIKSIIKMNGNTDTAIALALFTCTLQIILAYIYPNQFNPRSGLYLYACIALIGLFFNTLGKYLITLRVKNNFRFLTSRFPKYAAKICSDDNFINKISNSTQIKKPIIAYQSKTNFFTNFLKLSYAPDPCENLARNIAPIGIILSILIAAVEFIVTIDIFKTVSLLAIISCMFIPMSSIVAINAQVYSFCKKALKHGTMLSGFPSIKQFSDVNSLMIDSDDLYKRGSVVLRGIKTFGTKKIDEGILYAAAIIKEVKGPLLPVFYQIINGRDYILPEATDIKYVDSKGIVASVGSKKVLIGNRKLLKDHDISPKSLEYEQKYKKSGNEITYFAIEDELVAMFILSYIPDSSIAQELQRLEYNGISLIVRTVDSNITQEMIAKQFGLFLKTVNVVPTDDIQTHNKEKEAIAENSRAYLATKGSISSLARAISACVRIKLNAYLAMIIQVITVVLGYL